MIIKQAFSAQTLLVWAPQRPLKSLCCIARGKLNAASIPLQSLCNLGCTETLTLWCQLLPYGYIYKASHASPG